MSLSPSFCLQYKVQSLEHKVQSIEQCVDGRVYSTEYGTYIIEYRVQLYSMKNIDNIKCVYFGDYIGMYAVTLSLYTYLYTYIHKKKERENARCQCTEYGVNCWLTDVLNQVRIREDARTTKQLHSCIQRLRDSQARKLYSPVVAYIYIYTEYQPMYIIRYSI